MKPKSSLNLLSNGADYGVGIINFSCVLTYSLLTTLCSKILPLSPFHRRKTKVYSYTDTEVFRVRIVGLLRRLKVTGGWWNSPAVHAHLKVYSKVFKVRQSSEGTSQNLYQN